MNEDLKGLLLKLITAVLTLLVTGLCYFVWDLHAWKAVVETRMTEVGYVTALDMQRHVGGQELVNQKIVLLFKLQGVAKEVSP